MGVWVICMGISHRCRIRWTFKSTPWDNVHSGTTRRGNPGGVDSGDRKVDGVTDELNKVAGGGPRQCLELWRRDAAAHA